MIPLHCPDTPSNCKMLSMLLRGRDIESDIVENGRLAVQAVACKGPYDFIFMDFTMPIMVSTVYMYTFKFGHLRISIFVIIILE